MLREGQRYLAENFALVLAAIAAGARPAWSMYGSLHQLTAEQLAAVREVARVETLKAVQEGMRPGMAHLFPPLPDPLQIGHVDTKPPAAPRD